jgi:predicted nucleic acid-binding protein
LFSSAGDIYDLAYSGGDSIALQLRMFDSIVIAAVPEAVCDTLYSDDMEHKQAIFDHLTIVGFFIY